MKKLREIIPENHQVFRRAAIGLAATAALGAAVMHGKGAFGSHGNLRLSHGLDGKIGPNTIKNIAKTSQRIKDYINKPNPSKPKVYR